jgi:hypothetical protein
MDFTGFKAPSQANYRTLFGTSIPPIEKRACGNVTIGKLQSGIRNKETAAKSLLTPLFQKSYAGDNKKKGVAVTS